MLPHSTQGSPPQIGKDCTRLKPVEYSVTPGDRFDLKFLSNNLRPEDTAELFAASGKSNIRCLVEGVRHSDIIRIGYADGVPFVIWGTVPGPHDSAAVWMVGTDGIITHSREFLRRSKSLLKELHDAHALLFNFADCRNTIHHRWLRWLSFKFIRKVHYGHENRLFFEFARLADNV